MKKIVCIATIKKRESEVIKAINSLYKQVDEVFVVFRHIPKSKLPSNVTYVVRSNEKGDADKFWLYSIKPDLADVWFFCDDDILYPSDYVETSLRHLNKFPNAVLSYHGRTIKKRPIDSYYRKSRIKGLRCTHEVKSYTPIGKDGTCGTGVMFFNSGVIDLKIEDFKYSNMADIWITKFATEQGKVLGVCPHPEGWIKAQESKGIFETHQFNDDKQTKLYNSINT